MKTTKILVLVCIAFLFGAKTKLQAQATKANTTNTVVATDYLGSGSTSNFDVLFKRNAVSAGLLSTTKTLFGVNSSVGAASGITGVNGIAIGVSAGQFSSSPKIGSSNLFIGNNAGKGQSSSVLNTGYSNTFVGNYSAPNNTSGRNNSFFGSTSGASNTSGEANTFIGSNAGYTFTTQSGNVCIGSNASLITPGEEKLVIDNLATDSPLIWGDFAADQLKFNGRVGIGGDSTTGFGNYPTSAGGVDVSAYQLFVKGGILTEEVRVSLATTWADYVFNKDYNLKPLSEVEKFIKANGHLPNVPSATQVKEEGIELGNMSKIQQEKIEELTLYIIELNKKLEAQQKQIDALLQNK